MDTDLKDNSKFAQESVVIDATRLIKKYAEEYDIPAQWIMSRFTGPVGRTFKMMKVASHARHRSITELADMGYSRDLIARSFDIGRDAVNTIISRFRKNQNLNYELSD